MDKRFPIPPFTMETALQKVQAAEDAWNTKDPERVSMAYTIDTEWRNRTDFINGREEVKAFLKRKWEKELDYRLKKELWGFRENRMAVRFEYEWHDAAGQWYRSYGTQTETPVQRPPLPPPGGFHLSPQSCQAQRPRVVHAAQGHLRS